MKIMFWNTKKNSSINDYIVSLICEYDIDVFIMAEYAADAAELKSLLIGQCQNFEVCNTLGCNRLEIWSKYVDIKPGIQETYYSIQIIENQYILCGVHLMSDAFGDCSDERFAIIQKIMHDIKDVENVIKSKRTMIVGDFNEMPYDKGCLSANGFHGLPELNEIDLPVRMVSGVEYRKFYNPMWNFMGDFLYPPGTYYLSQSKLYSPMWHMPDQVIVSKELLPWFRKESLKIVTSCGYLDLADEKRHPNKKISDHFPVMCEIEDEVTMEVQNG